MEIWNPWNCKTSLYFVSSWHRWAHSNFIKRLCGGFYHAQLNSPGKIPSQFVPNHRYSSLFESNSDYKSANAAHPTAGLFVSNPAFDGGRTDQLAADGCAGMSGWQRAWHDGVAELAMTRKGLIRTLANHSIRLSHFRVWLIDRIHFHLLPYPSRSSISISRHLSYLLLYPSIAVPSYIAARENFETARRERDRSWKLVPRKERRKEGRKEKGRSGRLTLILPDNNYYYTGMQCSNWWGGWGGWTPPVPLISPLCDPPTPQVLGLLAVLLTPPVHFSQFEHCRNVRIRDLSRTGPVQMNRCRY